MKKFGHRFGQHLAYHNPRIEAAIRVRCFTPEGSVEEAGSFEVVFDLGGIIYEPDKAREEAGLGTYETQMVDEISGTLADVRVGEDKSLTQVVLEKVAKAIEAQDKTMTEAGTVPAPKKKRKAKKRRKTKKGLPTQTVVSSTAQEAQP